MFIDNTTPPINYSQKLRLLIVDDVAVHRTLLMSGLRRINPFLEIEQAASVDEAIELLSQGKFDAVVCDWMMPGQGGEVLLRWMRARPMFKYVPFVMISSKTENEDIIEAFMALGVDGYITKPFTPSGVYGKVTAAIEKLND